MTNVVFTSNKKWTHVLPVALGPPIVYPDADEVGIHELCADRAEDVVLAVLHEAQLPRVEDEADVVVLKVELLVAARRRPGDLTQQIFA